jgi:hypothetical protein
VRDERLFDRLAKLCGLLGSPHEGERAAAALKATELLGAMKMSWADLVGAASGKAPPEPTSFTTRRPPRPENTWQPRAPAPAEHVALCLDLLELHRGELSDFELSFLLNLTARFKFSVITEKQEHVLSKIVRRFYPSCREN